MNYWIIASWVFVAIFTAINIFVFLKLKQASEQMMKMVAPGAKNMNDAVAQMQGMLGGIGGKGGGPNMQALMSQMNNPNMQAQMKAAMDMLSKMQNNKKR